ncbi:MAG: hypothetical protein OIF50_02860 [Flavobacteriaceae bacterium]|nr:hypothetical protein [Flavobacteriaceae bacterium]
MKNNTSVTLGVRLEKARIMDTTVSSLKQFEKNEAEAIADMRAQYVLCQQLLEQQSVLNTSKLHSVALRKDGFTYSDEENMMYLLTDISNYLRGKRTISKISKKEVYKIIRKIRGTKTKKKNHTPKNDISTLGAMASNTDDGYVKNKTLGYGNKLANFKRILVILASFGPVYKPGNKKIQIEKLQSFHNRLEKQNRTVVISKKDFKEIENQSIVQGQLLMAYCSDLKYLLRSETRNNPLAFDPVKSIRFV